MVKFSSTMTDWFRSVKPLRNVSVVPRTGRAVLKKDAGKDSERRKVTISQLRAFNAQQNGTESVTSV